MEQLVEIMGDAHERKFASNIHQTPQLEASEAKVFFEISNDRLNRSGTTLYPALGFIRLQFDEHIFGVSFAAVSDKISRS